VEKDLSLLPQRIKKFFINSTGGYLGPDSSAFSLSQSVCKPFSEGHVERIRNKFSETFKRGWYVKFTPKPNEYGIQYNQIAFIFQEVPIPDLSFERTSPFTLLYYFINIFPVNDEPKIFTNSSGTLSEITSSKSYTLNFGTNLNPVLVVQDEEAIPNEAHITLTISLNGPAGSLATQIDGQDYGDRNLVYKGSQSQVNAVLYNLIFSFDATGDYTIDVSVNDGGVSGGCPPESGRLPELDGTCPQTKTIQLSVSVRYIDFISSTAFATSAAGALLVGLGLGFFAIRRFRSKKEDGWKEFDEENFLELGQNNPIYERDSIVSQNPIYLSSRDSNSEQASEHASEPISEP